MPPRDGLLVERFQARPRVLANNREGRPWAIPQLAEETGDLLDEMKIHPVYGFLFQQRGPAGMQAAGGLMVSGIGSNSEQIDPMAMSASELYRASFAVNGRGARR